MHEEIIAAGYGGQGVMMFGRALANAAMVEGRQVTFMPSYGIEVRGGAANCSVIISNRVIHSPIISNPTVLVLMNQIAFERFISNADNACLLIINSSLIDCEAPGKNMILAPFSDMAVELGDIRAANMIALGLLALKKNLVSAQTLKKVIKNLFPGMKESLLTLNYKALEKGTEYI